MLARIREHHLARGTDINQAIVIGETMSLFEELETEAQHILVTSKNNPDPVAGITDRIKSVELISKLRGELIKQMQSLGLLKNANVPQNNTTVNVGINNTPFYDKIKAAGKVEDVGVRIIEMTQDALEEPEPPEEEPAYVEVKEEHKEE